MRLWDRKPRTITAMGGLSHTMLAWLEELPHPIWRTTGLWRNSPGMLPLQHRETAACRYDHLCS